MILQILFIIYIILPALIYLTWKFFDYYKLKNLSKYDQNQKFIIIGTGFSGLLAGIKLKEMGIKNFKILEMEPELGGTWYKNIYPGAECDIKSHLYSYSFELNPNWKKNFPVQKELLEYVRKIAKKYDLERHIICNSKVISSRWQEKTNTWDITVVDTRTQKERIETTNFVLLGPGGLNIPSTPKFPGAEDFKGKSMHTAKWDSSYDYKNKNVVVIGSAASSIQVSPAIAKDVKSLVMFQRTPNYILPKFDYNYPSWLKNAFKYVPFFMKLYRYTIFLRQEAIYFIFKNKRLNNRARKGFLRRLILPKMKNLSEDLKKKLIPTYSLGCKRILQHDHYYEIFERDNVTLETNGIKQIKENSVIATDGKEYKNIDLIIYATGFQVGQAEGIGYGVDGWSTVEEEKLHGLTSYKSTFLPKFPNTFGLMGANSGLGHNSYIYMLESQMRYIMKLIEHTVENQYKYIEVKQKYYDDYQKFLIPQERNSIWFTGGCQSWYKTAERLFTLHVGFATQFWWRLRNADPEAFIFRK